MTRPLSAFLLGAGLTFGCSDDAAQSPTLTLQVQTHADGGWADCNKCSLVAGRDKVRFVSAYDALSFPQDKRPAPPSLTLRLDGHAVDDPPTMSQTQGTGDTPTYQSTSYALPGKSVSTLSARVEGGAGYFKETGDYQVELVEAGAPVEATLSHCQEDTCTEFTADLSSVHVSVAAWLDAKTPITLSSFVDGAPDTTLDRTFEGDTFEERRAQFDVDVPNVDVDVDKPRAWRLEFATDGIDIPAKNLTLNAPDELKVVVTGCGAEDCSSFPASVGKATVEVTGQLDPGDKLTLRSVVAGVLGETQEQTLVRNDDESSTAQFVLDVPDLFIVAGKEANWNLEFATDIFEFSPKKLKLTPPPFTAAFVECVKQSPCKQAGRAVLHLQATVPAAFGSDSISVRLLVDGLLQPDNLELDFAPVDANERIGAVPITLPSGSGKQLTAKAYFGSGYVQTASVTIK